MYVLKCRNVWEYGLQANTFFLHPPTQINSYETNCRRQHPNTVPDSSYLIISSSVPLRSRLRHERLYCVSASVCTRPCAYRCVHQPATWRCTHRSLSHYLQSVCLAAFLCSACDLNVYTDLLTSYSVCVCILRLCVAYVCVSEHARLAHPYLLTSHLRWERRVILSYMSFVWGLFVKKKPTRHTT